MSVRSFTSSWNAFWFAKVPPDIFAILRILFGLLGLISLVGLLDLPLFWSCEGLVASADSAVCRQFQSLDLGWLPGSTVLAFAAISFAGMAVGYQTRFLVLCAFGSISLMALWNSLPLSAAHQVLRSLLFCLIWADCGRVWSVDAWRRRRNGTSNDSSGEVAIWPLRLIRIQVGAIYFVTGLWKLNNVIWRDGSALHYVFENPQFRRFDFLALPALDPWLTLGTYATLVWELSFAFLVAHQRARAWVLATGVALHLGMWATLELGPFSWIILASYVAFLDPIVVQRHLSQANEPRDRSGVVQPSLERLAFSRDEGGQRSLQRRHEHASEATMQATQSRHRL